MKKIAVATDFSEGSQNAVRYAADMAAHFNARLIVIHIYESPLFYTAEMPYTAIEAAENLAKTEADSKMHKLMEGLQKSHPQVDVTAVVKRGISADAITEETEKSDVDLLITGSTGAGVVERTLVGSTTTAIINKSKCQVLIVPEKGRFKAVDKLVYSTDLNDDNIRHANDIVPLAKALNAEIVFLFVDNKIHTDSDKISDEMAARIRSHVHYPKTSGYICTDPDVMNGITLFVHKQKADMVVMLTHPRTFPRMLWDKSITKKFSYHPEVPLLVLHAAH